ncbi:MAG: ubiquinol oxidase subunit II [Gammaproteobacteria bacterium]|nr:MAG: ubiquinol oxidase subunit II [Gammaproteobacteria bacterium]
MVVSSNKRLKQLTALVGLPLIMMPLTACSDLALFDSKGPVGQAIGDTMIYTVLIMLIVVIPTICLSIYIPYKYRAGNDKANYQPEWSHSNLIELIVWGIPIAIIVTLGIETYKQTHALDPHKELISEKAPMERPLKIQVVALNWKWLFIYPEEGIATINEIAIPVDKPVQFLLTSDAAINSFFIPQLGGQLYAMSGMENKLNLLADEEGVYQGMSSNYSGFGFSGMRFNVLVKNKEGYDAWVNGVKNSGNMLDDATYAKLKLKSRDNPVEYYVNEDPLRYKDIIDENAGLKKVTPVAEHSESH